MSAAANNSLGLGRKEVIKTAASEEDLERYLCELLGELSWEEVDDIERDDKLVVVDWPLWRSQLELINRDFLDSLSSGEKTSIIDQAIKRLEDLSTGGDDQRSAELLWQALVDGLAVDYSDSQGDEGGYRLRLIDWDNLGNNVFQLVRQLQVRIPGSGLALDRADRPDVVMFVNGMPLVLVELKRSGVDIRRAYEQLQRYRDEIPQLTVWSQLQVITGSNLEDMKNPAYETRLGSLGSPFERFSRWLPGADPADKAFESDEHAGGDLREFYGLIFGALRPAKLMEILSFGTLFQKSKSRAPQRVVAQQHQLRAARNIVDRLVDASISGEPGVGTVWHATGTGKTVVMEMAIRRALRTPGLQAPTFLMLADEKALARQLFDRLSEVADSLGTGVYLARKRKDLREELSTRTAAGVIVSTLQKIQPSEEEREGDGHPLLSDRDNIVIFADEAHRSHYNNLDGFAAHLSDALPRAKQVAITATPRSDYSHNTASRFGPAIDIYTLGEAQRDRATVPILYDSSISVPLRMDEQVKLNQEMAKASAGAKDETKVKAVSALTHANRLQADPDRIRELAENIYKYISDRIEERDDDTFIGKNLIATNSKKATAMLYAELGRINPDWVSDDINKGRIKVVFSSLPGDKEDPLRKPHLHSDGDQDKIAARLRDPNDELELVIVCDMWLVGFDAPIVDTIFLDKPGMTPHDIVQTLSRANRVFPGKEAATLVDCQSNFSSIIEAMHHYSSDENVITVKDIDRNKLVDQFLDLQDVAVEMLEGSPWEELFGESGEESASDSGSGDASGTSKLDADESPAERRERLLLSVAEHLAGEFSGTRWQTWRGRLLDDSEDPVVIEEAADYKQTKPQSGIRIYQKIIRELLHLRGAVSMSRRVRARREETVRLQELQMLLSAFLRNKDKAELEEEAKRFKKTLRHMTPFVDAAIDSEQATGRVPILEINRLTESNMVRIKTIAEENPNIGREKLISLIEKEIEETSQVNVARSLNLREKLKLAVAHYNESLQDNNLLHAELIHLAQDILQQGREDGQRGLTRNEIAFYEALTMPLGASIDFSEDDLLEMTRELIEEVEENAGPDWEKRENVKAKLRLSVKRVLRSYGYPKENEAEAIQMVLDQAMLSAAGFSADAV